MLVMDKSRDIPVLCQVWRIDWEFCRYLITKQQRPSTGNNKKVTLSTDRLIANIEDRLHHSDLPNPVLQVTESDSQVLK